jgi:hypothetical protein
LYFNSVGESVEEGRVGMGVAGIGVGEGPSVGGGPIVLATTVLTSAVITIGVTAPLPPLPLAGIIGAHAARTIAKRIVKAVDFFISVSFS